VGGSTVSFDALEETYSGDGIDSATSNYGRARPRSRDQRITKNAVRSNANRYLSYPVQQRI
jgi:hypothetical protein